MSHPYANELIIGLAAVRAAAKICQVVQSTISPETLDKKDNSPVTVADFASQAVICHALSEEFPSDPIIAEEDSLTLQQSENHQFLNQIHGLIEQHYRTASNDDIRDWIDRGGAKEYSSRFWTLDPIDGTKGFLRRDQFAISLALIVDGKIKLGILGCPNLGTKNQHGHSLFYAILGQGAFATRLDADSETKRIQVTKTSDSSQARFCESFESGHSSHSESALIAEQLGIKTEPVRMDSQAKYATVAGGEAEIYLRLPAKTGYYEKIWDHAGGVLIVQEAGGHVTDLQGKSLDFSRGRELRENRGVIVTNGALHAAVLDAAQTVTLKSQSMV
jgi:3'(2'), 5'-bisphosphate nucleotidase